MATLVLATAGAAVGGALMPAGVSLMGATLSGAVIGRAVGSVAGRYIDQALFGASGQSRIVENTGARLSDLQVTSSSEGTPIARIFGRARLGGQIIWATGFEEEVVRDRQTSGGGGKGMGGGGGGGQTTITTSYHYYGNFAIALCEGEISRLGRVWADGKQINIADFTYRLYRGTADQLPDSLIEAKQGAGHAPAYRNLAYIVFERLPLERFGNRIPQFNFEIFKALDDVEQKIRAVTLIPASGEFAYEVEPVERDAGQGKTVAVNTHHQMGGTDWSLSLDQLRDMMPNCGSVSLFVSWFGTDLRAANCLVRPAVEIRNKVTTPYSWKVAGQTRANAHLVSQIDERPAYGGTPSDRSVLAAIADLKARGLAITFNPFLMMDIAADNNLPDPYGGQNQPAFPWRGRISCFPAAGQAGSVDKSAAARAQIELFTGTCTPADFDISSGEVVYSGPDEWGWRRMVLHYAHLCKLAGGVDAFLLGSELRGLTQIRDEAGNYPFVAALVQLAADVKSVLGSATKVSYGADWSEYFGHQPGDGSGDVLFHLDPLWSSDNIDMIAMDCYWPLADWRDDDNHLDGADWLSIYDPDYLKSNIGGGEGYDWYYASAADRDSQTRTPISDGAGKPWIFRYKDLVNWWSHQHFDRPGGVEMAAPTGWVPHSKPFWLMEIGCPAVDKGANEPNLFTDPKSTESRLPHFSQGHRDDTMQRRYLQAFYEYFDPAHADFVAANNPASTLYNGHMVEISKIHAYTWDARPFPAFPYNEQVWSDGANWHLGHWLNGRMAGGPLQSVVKGILDEYGFEHYDLSVLDGMMEGYILDSVMSARDALQPLEMAFFLDSFESGGKVCFAHKGQAGVQLNLSRDELVEGEGKNSDLYNLTRAQETDLPVSARLSYIDGVVDYRQAVVEARRQGGATSRVSTAQLPIVLGQEQAQGIADSWLHDVWSGREKASFSLPPSKLALEPGDVVQLGIAGRKMDLRISQTGMADALAIESLSLQPHIYKAPPSPKRTIAPVGSRIFGPSQAVFLDLPLRGSLLPGGESASNGYVAAFATPWPGAVSFYRSAGESGFSLAASVGMPAIMGETLAPLKRADHSRWDHGNVLEVELFGGELRSRDSLDILSGGNLAAIEQGSGKWEIFSFRKAELVAPRTYHLSELLRGQGGTEVLMGDELPAGARFILLDDAVTPVPLGGDEVGLDYNWKVGPAPYDLGHRSYRSHQKAFTGLGLKPLAPVHVRALAAASGGGVTFSWIRRTRTGGDNWQSLQVPLGEDVEAYELDIIKNGAVVRTMSSNTPSLIYSAAQQSADFGSPQNSFELLVYQMSAVQGRGSGAAVSLSL